MECVTRCIIFKRKAISAEGVAKLLIRKALYTYPQPVEDRVARHVRSAAWLEVKRLRFRARAGIAALRLSVRLALCGALAAGPCPNRSVDVASQGPSASQSPASRRSALRAEPVAAVARWRRSRTADSSTKVHHPQPCRGDCGESVPHDSFCDPAILRIYRHTRGFRQGPALSQCGGPCVGPYGGPSECNTQRR